ncbi:MAG: phage terminase large subunit [Ktedonobacterales bacterium]
MTQKQPTLPRGSSNDSLEQERALALMPAGLAWIASGQQWQLAPHLSLLNKKLLDVSAGRTRRLLVQIAPRHGKSELVSKYFPAWYLGIHPEHRFMLCGYGDEFAATWGRRARDVLAEWGPKLYGVRVSDQSSAADRWDIHKHRGGLIAAGVGGQITGHGAHCLVIDDPHKDRKEADSAHARDAVWEWYTDTVYPRLEPNGKIVLVMQRWHEDDLAGKLLKAAAQGGDQWDVISLPAIAEENDQLGRLPGQALWPERFSVAELERIRANMSPRGWISQYQQRPVADGGTTFKAHWLSRRYHELPGQRRVYKRKVMAIDTAFKTGVANDFSVIQIWGEGDNSYYLIDMWREQVEYPDLKRAIIDQFNLHRPDVILIEDAASGQSIIQDLQRNTTLPIVAVKAKGSKQARADSVTPLWEAGKVLLPEEAPWLHVFLEEHLAFPFGGHDDTVDPGVYALKRLSERGEVGTMPSILDDAPVDERLNVWDALPEAIWDD